MESTSIDDVIAGLPKAEQRIVKRLMVLIRESLPQATEKNSDGMPVYSRNRAICFIWPPSISLGKHARKNADRGVILGFCQGHLFANADGALLAEGRKQGYYMYFKSLAEINDEQIRALLFEGELIDQQFKKKKKRS